MVKLVRALLVTAAVLGGVSGCNLGVGIFPHQLMTYEAYADLSGLIERDRIWDYNFQIIRDSSSGTEYLVLASDNRGYGGVHVVIFDADLKVLGKYTIEELDAMNTVATFGGRGAMVAANGSIVVGNREFTVTTRKATYAGTPPMTLHGLGLALPEAAEPNYVNIWTENLSTVFFKYTTFKADWSTNSPRSRIFKADMFEAGIFNLWVRDTDVAAIIGVKYEETRIHLLDRVNFAANILCEPVRDCPPVSPVFAEDKLWWRTLGYTDAGFAAFFDDPIRKYVLFGTNGLPITQSTEVSGEDWPNDQLQVYGRTAGWYILRMKDMTLERRPWWWL
jgi:hypothetical protein